MKCGDIVILPPGTAADNHYASGIVVRTHNEGKSITIDIDASPDVDDIGRVTFQANPGIIRIGYVTHSDEGY